MNDDKEPNVNADSFQIQIEHIKSQAHQETTIALLDHSTNQSWAVCTQARKFINTRAYI